jgi:phage shock protein PspC (stress-responsive transcriptional regulator)
MDMEKNGTQNDTENTTAKKLHRPRGNRMLAGVCSGTAEFLGIDPNIVRIGLVVFNIFGGAGVGLYLIGWALMPEEDAQTSIAEDFMKNMSESPTVKDAIKKTKDAVGKNRTSA